MENYNKKIENFCKRRLKYDNDWLCGNCYWYARILCDRFRFLKLMYLQIKGHFVAYDPQTSTVWDYSGVQKLSDIEKTDAPILWNELWQEDYLLASRIVKDCII